LHKRYLDCDFSELSNISKADLLEALRSSEGRILLAETIGSVQPMLFNITNAEFAASQGADLLLLNMFDVSQPCINAMPAGISAQETLHELKRLTGRVIGINLEPVDPGFTPGNQEFWSIKEGRLATADNARKAVALGVQFLVLTGNPGNGVSNSAINCSLREIKREVGDTLILIAGKMHASGIQKEAAVNIITESDITEFVEHGADVILLPAPGTVPGITLEYARQLISHAHQLGVMTLTTIGTSQEGADVETIRQIALMCKMAGTDLHHLGDAGYVGMALPENIMAYSIAIRGKRHTYARMARSINR